MLNCELFPLRHGVQILPCQLNFFLSWILRIAQNGTDLIQLSSYIVITF